MQIPCQQRFGTNTPTLPLKLLPIVHNLTTTPPCGTIPQVVVFYISPTENAEDAEGCYEAISLLASRYQGGR